MNFPFEQFSIFREKAEQLINQEDRIAKLLHLADLGAMVEAALENEISSSNGIEGINLESGKIRSSIARSLGLVNNAWSVERQDTGKEERAVRAAVHFLGSGTELSLDDILDAHSCLSSEEDFGRFRNHPEYVFDENNQPVYECPPANHVPALMEQFIKWWNGGRRLFPAPVGSALGHFIFVTIHPFRDGNGRMARMIADKALIRNAMTFRFFSISAAIRQNKNDYYDLLNNAQTKSEIPEFVEFILKIQESALEVAHARAKKLVSARNLVNSQSFSAEEKAIIYEMALGDRQFWSFFESTKFIVDGELAEKAWARLNKIGIIKNGTLNLAK